MPFPVPFLPMVLIAAFAGGISMWVINSFSSAKIRETQTHFAIRQITEQLDQIDDTDFPRTATDMIDRLRSLNEAKELSHLLARVGSHLLQSATFVRDHDSTENFEAYRTVIGKLMGDLYLDAMAPLYNRFPELLPDYLDGPYQSPDSTYLPKFYGSETGGGTNEDKTNQSEDPEQGVG